MQLWKLHQIRDTPKHVNMSRRGESPLSSRMIFTSSSAVGDHERGFAAAGAWSPRCYACSFCGREFKSAQALGGHMNIHRRDRARLRTHHADLPPAPQNTPKSGHRTLYLPLEAACTDSPTSISSGLNPYPPPTIISATPTFKPLVMRSVADPPLLAIAAPPSHDENSAASFSVPISDLVSFRFGSTLSSSTTSFSNGAHSLFPNIPRHASSLLITPMLENSSFKPAEALNVSAGAGQASTRQFRLEYCSGAKATGGYNAPQRIQFSQAKGRHKRTRGNDLDAVKMSSEDKLTVQRCHARPSTSVSSTVNFNSLHTAAAPRSCVRRSTHDVHNDIKELNCLDLELRLGQSSSAPASRQI